jgi:hypothetical protein
MAPSAAARYNELALLDPEAFAGHAADFLTPEQESYEAHRG